MKNVLVIVYYFPPMGGSGVQRPLKFVKYLREFGWNPIVLCPEPGAYHVFDDSLQKELEEMNVEVHKVEGRTPLHAAGDRKVIFPKWVENLLRKISTFFWLPDNKKGWIKTGFLKAGELIKSKKIDVIFASAPPYSNLILAKKIKESFNVPVVMDLRDDWLESHLIKYPSFWHYSKMKAIEKETLSIADQLVTINNVISESIDKRAVNAKKTKVITQGFDSDDFDSVIEKSHNYGKLTFLYSGTFYPESGPEVFLKAMSAFLDQNPKYHEQIQLQFQGVLGVRERALFKKYTLDNFIQDFGFLPHSEAVQNLKKADILWLNNAHSKNSAMLSLGKTYEYMASKKPILAMIPDGDIKTTLSSYGAAFISAPEDIPALVENITRVVSLWEEQKLPEPNKEFISKFNRKILTSELASIFNVISSE